MDEDKIRTRVSYRRFKDLLEFLNKKPSKKALLEKFHTTIDNANGYGSQTNANAALESLQLVVKENKL